MPSAGDGEAVVRVTAAALKPSDRWMANGFHHVRSDNSKRRASRTTAAGTGSAGFSQVAGLDGVGRLIAAAGPYDLVVDYLWGPSAEAAFAALGRGGPGGRIRYVLVGMTAGPEAALPAMALRRARVLLFGSGIGGEAPLAKAAAAYDRVLALAAAGQVTLDVDAVPLADVEKTWPRAGSDRRVVFVP